MMAADVTIPPLSQPGEGAYVKGELIYPLEGRPTPECHASTIAETPKGLVAAWFGGTREGHNDVGIWFAEYDGSGWSTPREVADGVVATGERYPCWNPVLFQPKGGPLLLFYKVGPRPSSWWGMLITSRDGGKTWSKPKKLGEDPAIGHVLGPVKNKPIALDDDTILCPSSTEHDGWRVHFEKTTDLGKTWEVIGPIHDGKEFAAIQPTLLIHSDGRLQALCRSRQGVIAETWSRDQGTTWGPVQGSTLPNPNSGIDGVTLCDGRHLLVYNHTTRASRGTSQFPTGRQMLNVAVTRDGVDWKPVLTLERSQGEYSYPAVIQASDGSVHVTYTFRRQSIKHVILDPAKIQGP